MKTTADRRLLLSDKQGWRILQRKRIHPKPINQCLLSHQSSKPVAEYKQGLYTHAEQLHNKLINQSKRRDIKTDVN